MIDHQIKDPSTRANSFQWLEEENQQRLKEHIYCRTYKKGQVLFYEGDVRDRIFLVIEGLVRIEKTDGTDSYCYVDFVGPDQLFPLIGLFERDNYDVSAFAATDIVVQFAAMSLFEPLVVSSTSQLLWLNQQMSRQLEKQRRRVEYCVTSSAQTRVVNTIGLLMIEHGQTQGEQIRIPFPVFINDIAKYGGTTRETVSQTLKALVHKRKIYYRYKELIIYDQDYFSHVAK
ncbi:CRP/FNR family transcriptional regulator, arginine deiminase pathway regulator [Enterococcus sp. DIV2379]|uniref:Crp/Fnr family transcriptional regulator n=1 Tax=Enterococcus sp. DIV2379 TaxID=2774684 RepID=UPI003D2FBC8B